MTNEYNEELLEHLAYYRNTLKDSFKTVTEEYFEELVKQSQCDIAKNAELVKKYEEISKDVQKTKRKYKGYSFIKWLLWIVGIGAVLWGGFRFYREQQDFFTLTICIILAVLSACLYFFIVKPAIKKIKDLLANLDQHLESLQAEGYEMMAPLNKLFHSQMTPELIKKAIPFIHLDLNFNKKRYEQLVKEYGFLEQMDENYSTLDIASGDILGNPFVFIKRLIHTLGTYTYTGSRTVCYSETYTDSDGHTKTRMVTETLHAELEKPGPYYSTVVSLVYGNEAAPNLVFHRKPVAKGVFDGLLKNLGLRNKIAAIRNKTEDALKSGGSFQGMANEEFDATFHALDRNNETEFRLLFTPLAQKNYKDIFDNSPYGDDFKFNKENKINTIETINSQKWDLDTGPDNYWDFSFEKIKEKFITFNCSYFDHMFFSFLPLLAIPLYQQMMSTDYIYKKSYKNNYNSYITEMIANHLGLELFRPQDADTRSSVKTILKTTYHRNENDAEVVQVDAHSYRTEKHVSYVPVRAGDGHVYDVPVEWEEYIPVHHREYMEVSEIDAMEDDFKQIKELDTYQRSIANVNKDFAYGRYMVGKFYRKNESLKELLQQVFENG